MCEPQGHCQCRETSLGLPHGVWKQTISSCSSCSYFQKACMGKIDFKIIETRFLKISVAVILESNFSKSISKIAPTVIFKVFQRNLWVPEKARLERQMLDGIHRPSSLARLFLLVGHGFPSVFPSMGRPFPPHCSGLCLTFIVALCYSSALDCACGWHGCCKKNTAIPGSCSAPDCTLEPTEKGHTGRR